MTLLHHVFVHEVKYSYDDFLNKAPDDLNYVNSLEIIYLYMAGEGEYKVQYYVAGAPIASDWLSEKEILENYTPLEEFCSEFNVKCFEKMGM